MRMIPDDELRTCHFNDATLSGFAWDQDSLRLFLALGSGDGDVGELICSWAADLRVDLDWSEPGDMLGSGTLLSVEGSAKKADDDRWRIELDFGRHGHLSFSCASVSSKPVSAA